MIYINRQLDKFKDNNGVITVNSFAEAYPALYSNNRQVRKIAVCFDKTGEHILVQTTLKTTKAIKRHIEKFVEKQKAELQKVFEQTEVRLNTLRTVTGENPVRQDKT